VVKARNNMSNGNKPQVGFNSLVEDEETPLLSKHQVAQQHWDKLRIVTKAGIAFRRRQPFVGEIVEPMEALAPLVRGGIRGQDGVTAQDRPV
jgi:hypothetical protein